jgi:hypothetical protein
MGMTLVFPDDVTLHFAVTGGLIPTDVLAEPIGTRRDDVGQLWITTDSVVPAENLQLLSRVGVEITEQETLTESMVLSHWLQLFSAVRDNVEPEAGPQTPILFELRDVAALEATINELLRQGHDRSAVRQVNLNGTDRFFLRVVGPPYYTLVAALDGDSTYATAFREAAPRVWVQYGYRHPYAERIDVPQEFLLLMRAGRHWETLPEGPFCETTELIDVVRPSVANATDAAWPEPIIVPLTPSPSASTDFATLWVVRQDAIAQMDALVERADVKTRNQLVFAVGEFNGNRIVVLRLRPSRFPPPTVLAIAEAYRSWLRLPNLYVPVGTRIDPPLRRDVMQKLLAANGGIITWLRPSDGGFLAESLSEDAFRPLSDWIENVLDREVAALTEWIEATEFGFGGLTVEEPAPVATSTEKKPRPVNPPAKLDEKKPPRITREARPMRRPAPIREIPRVELPTDLSELRQQLAAIEAEFLTVEGPLDDPRRQMMWPRIAELNAALRQPAEAALAWAQTIWSDVEANNQHSWNWVRSENALAGRDLTDADIYRLLATTPPTTGDVRALAAVVIWSARYGSPAPLLNRLGEIQSYLQVNERLLPVRVTWLAWSAWSKIAGGDLLTLVRARDRLLARLLERGLDADADLSSFLRFAGRPDANRLRDIREWINDIRVRIRHWYAEQTKVELNRDPTAAYIDLFFAFGLARLGEAASARTLVKQSEGILENVGDDTRDAHLVLLQALSWRVEEVLAGRPHSGPLPKELLDYLAQMRAETAPLPRTNEYDKRRTGPYAVERFREQSRIMEPLEKFDPYRHTRREGHDLVREAAKLPDMADPSSLATRINQLLRPTEGVPELRVRVLAECVPLAGRLSVESAGTLLEAATQTLAAARPTVDGHTLEMRLRLIERSLFFAAHFDRSDLVPVFVDHLARLFESDAAAAILEGAGYAMGQTLRSLRKLGIRDETVRILERLETALTRGQPIESLVGRPPRNWPAILQTLLHVAAGWIYFDNHARAAPVLDAARRLLFRSGRTGGDEVPKAQYVQVICNLIAAYGLLPPAEARARIGDLFTLEKLDRLPNTYTTWSYYSRFHLNVAEAVVLTLSSEDFTLGAAARRWLDEDEFLIRRRVHHDVRTALERG